MEYDWDDGNVRHIARHGVEPYEAEEAVEDPRRASVSARGGRAGAIGMTLDGRLLVVILEMRSRKRRVVTTRDATNRERRIYRRHNR